MSGHEQDTDVRDSTPNSTGPDRAAGGMGVSSERVGHTGPGQEATDGVRDTSATSLPTDTSDEGGTGEQGGTEDDDTDRLRETDEVQPDGLRPVAGYPSLDPRSEDKPYEPGGRV